MEVEGGVESWKEEPTARVVEPVAQSGADRSSPGKSKTARLRGCGLWLWRVGHGQRELLYVKKRSVLLLAGYT